ncbi:hypothetical protein HKX48_000467 [Thoreauomyces humboldtii]|nr:hypothetical protein HKX48_000467 [Thoreauomyces humboldtii]
MHKLIPRRRPRLSASTTATNTTAAPRHSSIPQPAARAAATPQASSHIPQKRARTQTPPPSASSPYSPRDAPPDFLLPSPRQTTPVAIAPSTASSSLTCTIPIPATEPTSAANTSTGPTHWLFAYGSLINSQSRHRTVPAANGNVSTTSSSRNNNAIPAVVHGLQRSWSYPCPRNSYTAVAVRKVPHAACNGVLVPLSDPVRDLPLLDLRETHYARTRVPLEDIRLLSPSLVGGGAKEGDVVWVYQQLAEHVVHIPTPAIPIPQSYVDCILTGCLQYGPAFARDFVQQTHGWDAGPWINDRHADAPRRRYSRRAEEDDEHEHVGHHSVLDDLLERIVPAAFRARVELEVL